MTFVQITNIFKEYSLIVLLLAAIVCGLTALIKIWVPDKQKKFLTFLPFILGIIVYGIYLLIAKGAPEVLKADTVITGFECGTAATIYYILYEQFIKNKKSFKASSKQALIIMGILSNAIKPEILSEVSEKVAYILTEKAMDESETAAVFKELILTNAFRDIPTAEVEALIRLINQII